MLYEKTNEEVKTGNTAPIEIVPLAEAFRDDLYNMYEVYRPRVDHADYHQGM